MEYMLIGFAVSIIGFWIFQKPKEMGPYIATKKPQEERPGDPVGIGKDSGLVELCNSIAKCFSK